ncbi:hypothetical protein EG329_002164 [Mollisiaceae sp. DMI_Dod_QoI]|nr:hypothetical protein EG329_002164 [Helotiales sp. DMI_Dod_QoI]
MHISAYKFTLFPQLPPELRLRIWFFALPRQRLVELKEDTTQPSYFPIAISERFIESVYSPTPVPSILHACKESRAEGLRHYKLTFRNQWGPTGTGRIYFDASVDILFMNCHGFPKFSFMDLLNMFTDNASIADMNNVVALAICNGLAENLAHQNRHKVAEMFMNGLKSLKRVICVNHGTGSLREDVLVPAKFDDPSTILKSDQIDALEDLFGVKLEFGISETENSEEPHTACKNVPTPRFA